MRQLRALFGAVLATALAAGGYLVLRWPSGQPVSTAHVMDRRCRGGCTDSALLRILPGGVSPSLIAAGTLSGSKGQAVTTTRASNKTCTKADGSLTYLGSNVPCVEAQGVLVEGSATNLFLQSAALDNATWIKNAATVTADTTVAPDGTTSAETVTDAATAAFHGIGQNITVTAAPWTASAFVKAGTSTCVSLVWGNSGLGAAFNPTTGAIASTDSGSTSSISGPYLGGYYRVAVTRTVTAGTDSPYLLANPSCVTGTPNYTGSGSTFIAWGLQAESQPFATSYIPTTTTSATRSADVVSTANPVGATAPYCFAASLTPESGAAWGVVKQEILDMGTGGSPNTSRLFVDVGTAAYFGEYDGAGLFKGQTGTTTLVAGSKHRFVGTKTAGPTFALTLDGAAFGSSTGTGTGIASVGTPLYIGTNTSLFAWGYLSDIVVSTSGCQ